MLKRNILRKAILVINDRLISRVIEYCCRLILKFNQKIFVPFFQNDLINYYIYKSNISITQITQILVRNFYTVLSLFAYVSPI